MGFEIKVQYESDDETQKNEKLIKVGKADDDTPLEVLASRIIGMMANRSKPIKSIELFEFRRKKVNFREDETGIYIGNNKFRFDAPPIISDHPIEEESSISQGLIEQLIKELANKGLSVSQNANSSVQTTPIATPQQNTPENPPLHDKQVTPTALRQVFNPPGDFSELFKKQGLSLTIGKIYDITGKRTANDGNLLYGFMDDKGKKAWLNYTFFDHPNSYTKPIEEDEIPLSAYDDFTIR